MNSSEDAARSIPSIQPGVTRDLREGDARLGDLRFIVIDSAGLEMAEDDSLQGRMRRLTERAVDEADICLFVIDARAGVTAADEYFADILRRRARHVITDSARVLAVHEALGAGVTRESAPAVGRVLSASHASMRDDFEITVPAVDLAVEAGEMAGIIGGLFVIGFMLLTYGFLGLLANIALIVNIVLLIALLTMLGATLTLPGIAATLGFVFTAAWSELLFALMLISGNAAATFPVGLLSFVSKFSVDFGQMMAAGVLALIPACLFFLLIQRYLVQGLTAGAVKG